MTSISLPLACRPIRLVSFPPPAATSASISGLSQVTKHQTPPNRKPARCGKGLCRGTRYVGDRGPPIGRTLGLVLSLKPRYHHTRRQGRWWLWAGRWSTTCGRISDECSWLDVSRARVMPVKPLGESPLLLGDEVAKERRGGRVELAQSLSLSIPSLMRKRMRPISLRIYAPVCLLHPQKAQSASFVHRGQDGVLSTTADLRAQGDRRVVKVSTKAGRQVGRRRASRPTSSKQ